MKHKRKVIMGASFIVLILIAIVAMIVRQQWEVRNYDPPVDALVEGGFLNRKNGVRLQLGMTEEEVYEQLGEPTGGPYLQEEGNLIKTYYPGIRVYYYEGEISAVVTSWDSEKEELDWVAETGARHRKTRTEIKELENEGRVEGTINRINYSGYLEFDSDGLVNLIWVWSDYAREYVYLGG